MGDSFKMIVYNPHKGQVTYEQDKLLRGKICKMFPDIEEIWLEIFYTFREDESGIEIEDDTEMSEVQVKIFQSLCYNHFGREFTCYQE